MTASSHTFWLQLVGGRESEIADLFPVEISPPSFISPPSHLCFALNKIFTIRVNKHTCCSLASNGYEDLLFADDEKALSVFSSIPADISCPQLLLLHSAHTNTVISAIWCLANSELIQCEPTPWLVLSSLQTDLEETHTQMGNGSQGVLALEQGTSRSSNVMPGQHCGTVVWH